MRLIDADALLEELESAWETITDVDDFYYFVKNANTIDAELVKHGRWIETIKGTCCSACKKNPTGVKTLFAANYNAPYCPRCGAKMDRKEEGK